MSRKIAKLKPLPFELKTIFWLFLLIIFWQVFSLLILPKAESRASDLSLENILTGVNRERKLRNLQTLNTDSRLNLAAEYKAEDMMNRHYFSHTDPEGNYIWNKIVEAGYSPYLQLGENLAIEFYNTESLVSAWMNSPTHRANVLNQGFNDQGMGLDFGNPQNGQYYSSIANTFGALLPSKKTESSPPQAPSPVQLPAAPNPGPVTTPPPPAKSEQQIPKSETQNSPQKSQPPIEQPRTAKQTESQTQLGQNFKLPTGQASTTSKPPADLAVNGEAKPSKGLSAYDINRYLMLSLGLVLIFMVSSDLKKVLSEKFHAYDKKINNLVLLILSLIVIAVMYWL